MNSYIREMMTQSKIEDKVKEKKTQKNGFYNFFKLKKIKDFRMLFSLFEYIS